MVGGVTLLVTLRVTNSPSTSETAVQQMPKAGSVLASSASASSASSSRVSLIVFTRLAVGREGGGAACVTVCVREA